MKKKIVIRFFAITLAAVLLMFIFGLVAVNMNSKNVVGERLKEETELAAILLDEEGDFSLFEKYKGNKEFRITVFDTDGNVLYESDTTAELDNHADREEIQNALSGNPKTVERYSETFKCDMTYYATKTTLNDGTEIILRLAVRSSDVSSYITSLLPLMIVVLFVALILSFVLSNVLSNSVSKRITEVGDSLKSLNEGQYEPIKTDMSEPELYAVLNQINELNANIHSHMRAVDAERVKLSAVLANVSQGIIALDKSRCIVFANKSAMATFRGWRKDVGRDLVYFIKNIEVTDKIARHLHEDYSFTFHYEGKELSFVMTHVTDEAISDTIETILIVTDITKEKLIEKQKSDFFANASHELKTPITVLQGFSEVLMNKEGMDETSKKQLARIHKESIRLGSLISDMLMLSKIESGDQPEKAYTEVSLQELAVEVLNELDEEMKKRGITATITGEGKVVADQNMIFELIENLVSNAVKYNKDGGTVTVAITDASEGVCLQVKDTGIGIEKEHLPRLCERFYRVDKSHSKRIGGTGLGLAIVKHICAIYNADLSIESEFGEGTTLTVVFPKTR